MNYRFEVTKIYDEGQSQTFYIESSAGNDIAARTQVENLIDYSGSYQIAIKLDGTYSKFF